MEDPNILPPLPDNLIEDLRKFCIDMGSRVIAKSSRSRRIMIIKVTNGNFVEVGNYSGRLGAYCAEYFTNLDVVQAGIDITVLAEIFNHIKSYTDKNRLKSYIVHSGLFCPMKINVCVNKPSALDKTRIFQEININ